MRKYTIEDKLKCVELADEIGYRQVSEITGIDRKSLREWSKKRNELLKIINKDTTFRLPGGGAKPKTLAQEKNIVNFVEQCIKVGIKIDSSLVINELCRINPEMLKKTRRALRKWSYRFLKRHNYA